MPGVAVYLDRPPHNARLLAWGRAPHGWWGLITWHQRVLANGSPTELPVAAWIPATSIKRPSWAAPAEIPRIQLPPDQRDWPAPHGWPNWYAGPWPNGALSLPPGIQLINGPAWRARHDRRK